MHLRFLSFSHFRNIEKAEIAPDRGFNVLWGENAQGKTNFLEGIYLLGTLRSFRGARNEDLVSHGASWARIRGEVISRKVLRSPELTIRPEGKAARLDGKELRSSPGDFFTCLRPVLFSPEEVHLAKGFPAGRRTLLDRAIFQQDVGYLERAREYDRYLKQRNKLLREGRPPAELASWTEGLIRSGALLRKNRAQYVGRLAPLLKNAYRTVAGGREEAEIEYPEGEANEEIGRVTLARELERQEDRERRLGQSLAGPHRDDLVFKVDGRPLKIYGSQGQQRSFILAFKAAQILDLESRTGEAPVLLLDDMTSELDRRRQSSFFHFLQERRGQVFITTTDIRTLIDEGFSESRFFKVTRGTVVQTDQRGIR